MPRILQTLLCLTVAALILAGCGKSEDKSGGVPSFEQLGKDADKAVAEGTKKLAESKEIAAKQIEQSLTELDERTKELRKKAEQATGDAKAELEKALIDLDKKSQIGRAHV